MKQYLPTFVVLACFLATLAVYAALRLNGTEPGVLDELLLIEGGAVAGVAAPGIQKRTP